VDQRRRTASAHLVVDDVQSPTLGDDAEHHVRRVLRLRDGASVTVTDGAGAWRLCTLTAGGLDLTSDVIEEPRTQMVTVAAALPKGDRGDWMVQKLVEVGVAEIVIVDAERSVVRWDAQRRERGRARLERIVTSAMEQSRRVHTPVLRGPVPAAEVLSAMPIAEPGGRVIRSDDVALAIGPEGGWSDAERAAASDMVDLGAGVLRVETAALVAATLMLACGQRP